MRNGLDCLDQACFREGRAIGDLWFPAQSGKESACGKALPLADPALSGVGNAWPEMRRCRDCALRASVLRREAGVSDGSPTKIPAAYESNAHCIRVFELAELWLAACLPRHKAASWRLLTHSPGIGSLLSSCGRPEK